MIHWLNNWLTGWMCSQEQAGDTPKGKLAELVCELACQEFPGMQKIRHVLVSARLGFIKKDCHILEGYDYHNAWA